MVSGHNNYYAPVSAQKKRDWSQGWIGVCVHSRKFYRNFKYEGEEFIIDVHYVSFSNNIMHVIRNY